jgi:hypothetical protein
MEMRRPTADSPGVSDADDTRMHRVECLRHLQKTDEVLRACKVALKPFGTRTITDGAIARAETVVRQRLSGLGVLMMRQMLFHTVSTFNVVAATAGSLMTFHGLLAEDPSKAGALWRRELRGEIAEALNTVMREVERLLKQI